MTSADGRAEDDGEALAREAAHWFARMRSPDAEESRAEFEAWLAQHPEHLVAYNRAAEIFAMGKLLSEPYQSVPAPAPRRRRVPAWALATAAACVVGIGGWTALHRPEASPNPSESIAGTADHRRISTIVGETRVVRLADGSTVHLGDGTVLDVDIAGRQRNLMLLQGQARFEVAHEQRPFIVHAGGGSVTARGTIFEVALTRAGKVDVRLLQGAVDVALPRPAPSVQPAIRKLAAGEGVSFAAQPISPEPTTTPAAAAAPPSAAARDFEAAPVGELVALANRGAQRPIRLADAALAGQRVSGRFRVDDTELLARRLAALFGRDVDTSHRSEIVLASAGGETPGAGKAAD